MKWVKIAIALFEFLPCLIGAIKAVEEAIPGSGKGEQKLALIRGLLEDIAKIDMAEAWPVLESWINKIVTMFNNLGIFTKKEDCPDGTC